MNLRLRRTIPAPPADVWFALTDSETVATWAGVRPARLRADYPAAGERALWRDGTTVLHDDILAVEPERLLRSRLRRGPFLVLEEYRLTSRGMHATELLAEWRGHPALVLGNDAAVARMVRVIAARVRHRYGTQSGRSRSHR